MPSSIPATINQLTQLGVEVTPGVAVAATKKLVSMGLPLNPAQNIQEFRPRGNKFATAHALNQEWSEGEVADDSGLAYNEIHYILASLLSKPSAPTAKPALAWAAGTKVVGQAVVENGNVFRVTVTDGADATEPTWTGVTLGQTVTHEGVTWINEGTAPVGTGFEWTFDIASYARDVIQTYTIESGDVTSGRGYQTAYCYFTGLEIECVRGDEVTISGDIVGNRRITKILTDLSATPEPQLVPATPAHLNVYMDNSAANLGTTQLDGNFSVTIALNDRATQAWFHGRQYQGPAGRVETPPEATIELVQADGEEVDTMLLALRNSQRKFFRFEWVGPEIVPGVYNRIQWDCAANIGDTLEQDDEDGVYAVTVPMALEHDGTWGRAMRVKVQNALGTL